MCTLFLLFISFITIVTEYVPPINTKLGVVGRFMTPFKTYEREQAVESHSSNIEEIEFQIMTLSKEGRMKHPNSTIEIHITRATCDELRFCFGHVTNLRVHSNLSRISAKTHNYFRKMAYMIKQLVVRANYEMDACKGMTVLVWKFPRPWLWTDIGYEFGQIYYSGINAGDKLSTYRYKVAGMSNNEVITFYHNDNTKKGIEINHGRMNVSKAYTTFYEDSDFFHDNSSFYIILAQDANKCGARLRVQYLPYTFMTRNYGFNFRPGVMTEIRKGINVWAVPLGVLIGSAIGITSAAVLLWQQSNKFYKSWNDEMKRTYGKFANVQTTMQSVMGGVSQMTVTPSMMGPSTMSPSAMMPSGMSTVTPSTIGPSIMGGESVADHPGA